MSVTIRVGGVPEHFNIPWHMALEANAFEAEGIKVEFIDFPGGTGAMRQSLRSDQIEIAVALTEGLVADIASNGPKVAIVGTYVQSPLNWAIAVGKQSRFQQVQDLKGGVFGISNVGSGSHIMGTVLADQQFWTNDQSQLDVKFSAPVGKFDALRNGVNGGDFDSFLWEYFMTKPYTEEKRNELRIIGTVSAPWPSFLVAARSDFADKHADAIQKMLKVISRYTEDFVSHTQVAVDRVSDSFHLTKTDAQKWLDQTHYPKDASVVAKDSLEHCVESLVRAKILTSTVPVSSLVHSSTHVL